MTSSFAKVYILKYSVTEKTIKSEPLGEKMLQQIHTGAGRCSRGGVIVVGEVLVLLLRFWGFFQPRPLICSRLCAMSFITYQQNTVYLDVAAIM